MKSVSNHISLSFYNQLQALGIKAKPLFASAGIIYEQLTIPDGRINALRHYKMLELVEPYMGSIEQLPCENPKLIFDDFIPLTSAFINAPSLREAIHLFFKYRLLIGNCDHFFVQESKQGVIFTYQNDAENRYASHSGFLNFLLIESLFRHYQPTLNLDREVFITAKSSKDLKKSRELMQCEVQAGEKNIYRLSSQTLDVKNKLHNPLLQNLLINKLDKLVALSFSNLNMSIKVVDIFREQLWQKNNPLENSNLLDICCQKLNTSRSTLARRLQTEKSSFSVLLKKFRRSEACRLLQQNECAIIDISDQLGFNNHSSFTRFFTDEFQQNPATFRKINKHK